MDRPDDDIEPASAGDERRRPDAVLPPLDLGDRAGGADGEPPRPVDRTPVPMWQRVLAVVAVLIGGVVVGTYGWRSIHQADDQVRLVAGPMELAVSRERALPVTAGPQQLRVTLFNDSAQDVQVIRARLTGWARPPGASLSRERVVPADGSAGVRIVAEPDCEGEPFGQVQVDVRTATGVSTVALPLPPEPNLGVVGRLYRQACEDAAPALSVHGVGVSREPGETRILPMSVRVLSSAPEARITAVSSTAPGFSVEGATLPTPLGPPPNAMVDLDWSVVDCAATKELGEVTIDAEVSTPDTTAIVPVPLGRLAVVELARFAGQVCPS